MNPTCSTCKFWYARPTGDGVCRRYAPKPTTLMQTPGTAIALAWPGTRADEWCGEYTERRTGVASTDPDREGLA